METTIFTIQDRNRPFSAAISALEHFTLVDGQPANPRLLIDEPGWSPYCLDDANRSVLFLQTPTEVDFSKAAFVYNAQFDHAQRAMTVPYAATKYFYVSRCPVVDAIGVPFHPTAGFYEPAFP